MVIGARREAEGTAATEQIVSEGGNAIFVKTNVADDASYINGEGIRIDGGMLSI